LCVRFIGHLIQKPQNECGSFPASALCLSDEALFGDTASAQNHRQSSSLEKEQEEEEERKTKSAETYKTKAHKQMTFTHQHMFQVTEQQRLTTTKKKNNKILSNNTTKIQKHNHCKNKH
jgi:hypothetical protein